LRLRSPPCPCSCLSLLLEQKIRDRHDLVKAARADAIKAAGDKLKGADLSDINLARIIKDGEQIYIYPPGKSGSAVRVSPQRAKAKISGPIALNRASAKDLESLDGIGPVLAARIVAYRNQNGPFLTVDDLMKVSGIGSIKFAQFKEKLRV
jgi:competence protein ComEA